MADTTVAVTAWGAADPALLLRRYLAAGAVVEHRSGDTVTLRLSDDRLFLASAETYARAVEMARIARDLAA
jgi:hypothetical protein